MAIYWWDHKLSKHHLKSSQISISSKETPFFRSTFSPTTMENVGEAPPLRRCGADAAMALGCLGPEALKAAAELLEESMEASLFRAAGEFGRECNHFLGWLVLWSMAAMAFMFHFIYGYIYGKTLPIDELIFFKMVIAPPTSS
jgi:hypothetical protein